MPIVSEPKDRVLGNRYRLVATLGSGSSAYVYMAEDVVLARRVAVKVLQPALVHDESFLSRFRAEARSVAALNHPHVLRVFDWGEDHNGPYLVLEYLEGGSLLEMFARGGRLSVAQAVRVGAQAADGLAYAHARGLVHRDVKPANLLFDEDGRVRVADFGIARAIAGAALTEPSAGMLGTARYASPEQALRHPLSGRTDVYSLALVLCEAVTGSVPFADNSPLATLQARIGSPLPKDEALGPLWPTLAAAAHPSHDRRPDAAAFSRRLRALAGELEPARPLPLARRTAADGGGLAATAAVSSGNVATSAIPRAGGSVLSKVSTTAALLRRPGSIRDNGAPTATVPSVEDEGARPHRRWPWVAAVLALLAVIVGAAATYVVQEKVFVPTRRLPRMIGEPIGAAKSKLLSEHFVVHVERAVKSTSIALGKVVSESPAPGAMLKEGSTVGLVPSAGLPTVSVPSLAGQIDCSVATRLLSEAHLKASCPARSDYSDTVPSGDVISWSVSGKPNPTSALYGTTVAVTVSKGKPPVRVPGVQGMSWAQADASLSADGLRPHEVLAYSTTVKSGDVVTTTPAPGTTVPDSSPIAVVVSQGSQFVLVPKVIGDTVVKAIAALQAAGLRAGPVYGPATGRVFTTDPLKGQKVKIGSMVVLYTIHHRR